jgi:hypothetical protein
MIETLLRDLRQPEYVHVLLNPLPIYGLIIAWLGLVLGLILRNRRAQLVGLVLVLICAASAWPVYEFGERAKDPVLSMENEAGQAWIEAHEDRAEKCIFFFYGLAVVAAVAIALPLRWPKTGIALAALTAVLGLVVLGMGGYIAYAGGKIRHHEFRNTPPPSRAETESRS